MKDLEQISPLQPERNNTVDENRGENNIVHPDDIPDNVLTKGETIFGEEEYKKCMVIGGHRYRIAFIRVGDPANAEFKIRFGLAMTEGNPVTNAGLDVFRQLTLEMHEMYKEIIKEVPMEVVRFYASHHGTLPETEEKIVQTIITTPGELNGFTFKDHRVKTEIIVQNNVAHIKIENSFGLIEKDIFITKDFLKIIEHEFPKLDSIRLAYELFDYIVDHEDVHAVEVKAKRLKLYFFYMKKQFPEFDYNVKTVMKEGRRVQEFEKDEDGAPYVRAILRHTDSTDK